MGEGVPPPPPPPPAAPPRGPGGGGWGSCVCWGGGAPPPPPSTAGPATMAGGGEEGIYASASAMMAGGRSRAVLVSEPSPDEAMRNGRWACLSQRGTRLLDTTPLRAEGSNAAGGRDVSRRLLLHALIHCWEGEVTSVLCVDGMCVSPTSSPLCCIGDGM
jgi:hypothetical protein